MRKEEFGTEMKKKIYLMLMLFVLLAALGFAAVGCAETVPGDALVSLAITTAPAKTDYYVGQVFDKTGMVVTVTYGNGETEEVTDYTVDKEGTLSATDDKIVVSYEGLTAEQPITVGTLASISITAAPTKTSYKAGDYFDSAGMVVTAEYSNGLKDSITDYALDKTGKLKATDKEVVVSYEGKTAVQPVFVLGVLSLEITKAPAKTDYIEGETFDPTGMEVVAKYSDDTTVPVTDYVIDKTEALTEEDTGVALSYDGMTVEQEITVGTLTGLDIVADPACTVYSVGEKFDPTGMKVVAVYSNGIEKEVTEYTIEQTEGLTWANKAVGIRYEDVRTEVAVAVVDGVLGSVAGTIEAEELDQSGWVIQAGREGLQIETPANTTSGGKSVGGLEKGTVLTVSFWTEEAGALNIVGMFAKYEDNYVLGDNVAIAVDGNAIVAPSVQFGHTEDILYTDWKQADLGTYIFTEGLHTLTLTVTGMAPNIDCFTFTPVEGAEKEAIGMKVATAPDKVEYLEGEKFDPTGIEIVMVYSDFSTEVVTDYTCDKAGQELSLSDRTVIFEKDGFSVSLAIKVNAAEAAFTGSGSYTVEAEDLDQSTWVIQPGRESFGFVEVSTNPASNPTSGGKNIGSLAAGTEIIIQIRSEIEATVTLTGMFAQANATYDLAANAVFTIDGTEIAPGEVTFGQADGMIYTNWKPVLFPSFELEKGMHTFVMKITGEGLNIDCFKFAVVDKADDRVLESIEITQQPTKTEYLIGEAFDPTGMVVTAVYDNGEREEISSSVYTVDKITFAQGDTKVVVSYLGKTAEVSVTVESKMIIATPDNSANKLFYLSADGNYIEIDRSGTSMFVNGVTDYVLLHIYTSPAADKSESLGTIKILLNKPFENGTNVGKVMSMDEEKSIDINGGPGNYFIAVIGSDETYNQFMEIIAHELGEAYSADQAYYLACQIIAEEPAEGGITIVDSAISDIGTTAWKAR